jgi:predicted HicB family RNase H-like nuclease
MPRNALTVRLPPDVHAWLDAQAERNGSSINSELIKLVRDAMDRQARMKGETDEV